MTPITYRHTILTVAQRVLQLSLLAGVILALFVVTNRAQADQEPTVVDAPGSIRGHVTNQQGEAIPNLFAALYSYPFVGSSSSLRQVPVDHSGNYTFSLLGPGIYRVGFVDSNQVYGRQFYSNSTQFSTAVEIPVIGQQISGIDAILRPGGTISGFVVLKDYVASYRGVRITLYERTISGWSELFSTWLGSSSDNFTLHGISSGEYRICAISEPVNGGAFWRGCYDLTQELLDSLSQNYCYLCLPVDLAADIVVTDGVTTTLASLDMFRVKAYPLPDGPGIFGKVLSEKGYPLPNVYIQAILLNTNSPIETFYPGLSNADGEFYVQVSQPGSYNLLFTSLQGNFDIFLGEYYQDAKTLADADIIRWELGQRISLPEIRLVERPLVKGKVTLVDGQQASYRSIIAWKQFDNVWQPVFNGQTSIYATTDEYQLRLPEAGKYRIEARGSLSGYGNNQEILSRFYGGADLETATDIVIELNEERSNINIVLGEDDFQAVIRGQVTNGAGNALPNIKVELFYLSGYAAPFIYTSTNASGYFTFTDLINGVYHLRYTDPSTEYATMYHLAQASRNQSSAIKTIGNAPATITATMQLAGKIEGRLRNDDDQSFNHASVHLYLVNATSSQFIDNVANIQTDVNGNFKFDGIFPGTYQLWFSHPSFLFGQAIPFGQYDFETRSYIASNLTVMPTQVLRADMAIVKFDNTYLPRVAK